MFYTYLHTRNDTGAVFYVGKGQRKRAHSVRRNQYWSRIVAKHGCTVIIVEHFECEDDAFAMERYLIASCRALGCGLTNMTDGGEGASGYHHTDDALAKLSVSMVGNTSHLGHPHSAESRAKMSVATKGKTNRLGYTYAHSAETKAKISAAQKGKAKSAETRSRMMGRHHSEETRAKISAALKGHAVSPVARAKISVTRKGKMRQKGV